MDLGRTWGTDALPTAAGLTFAAGLAPTVWRLQSGADGLALAMICGMIIIRALGSGAPGLIPARHPGTARLRALAQPMHASPICVPRGLC